MGFGRIGVKPESRRRFEGRRGSELVEGMTVLLPFMALVFVIIDASYGLFVKATLMNAAQVGVNYAVMNGNVNGLRSATTTAVQSAAFGLLNAGNGSTVTLNFYTPSLTTPPDGSTPNAAGNVVEVVVSYDFAPLAPLFRSGASIEMSAKAAGVLTASPPPPL